MKSITTKSSRDTQRLAEKLAGNLNNGDVVGLIGELGAGKTCFIQGLAKGLNVPESYYVSSPTFTIMKIYPGDKKLYHFDFYRLTDPVEFDDIGFEDCLGGDGVVVIEWADRFLDLLPKDMIVINFNVVGDNEREIILPEELESMPF